MRLAELAIALKDRRKAGRCGNRCCTPGVGIACLGVAALLMLAGLGLCLWGGYLWLSATLPPALAAGR